MAARAICHPWCTSSVARQHSAPPPYTHNAPPYWSICRLRLRSIKGAPLAIWLAILLDGIPESLVISASLTYHEISLALIAGLFLSNYPEALFNSLGMRQQGFSVTRVITM